MNVVTVKGKNWVSALRPSAPYFLKKSLTNRKNLVKEIH